jgi:tRNA threonylcarbamoyladenosine biosynthesis protein TsaB
MLTLALDFSGTHCAAALWASDGGLGRRLASRQESMAKGQAERAMALIEETLTAAGVGYAHLARLAAVTGPGSFTGIRVGLAAARGLALALNIPLVGIDSFCACVNAARNTQAQAGDATSHEHPLLAAIDSRRANIFVQAFAANGTSMHAPVDLAPQEVRHFLRSTFPGVARFGLTGDGQAALLRALTDNADGAEEAGGMPALIALPAPPEAIATAVARFASTVPDQQLSHYPPDPFYLRPPDVSRPKQRLNERPA